MTSPAARAATTRPGRCLPALTAITRRLAQDHAVTVVATRDLPDGVLAELDVEHGVLATDAGADPYDRVWLLADALALLSVGESASAATSCDPTSATSCDPTSPAQLSVLPGGREHPSAS